MKQIIVVEGKNDARRIKEIYPEAFVLTTNGKEIKQETVALLDLYKKEYEIILFLDPDFPGESIRKKLLEVVPNAKHAFIPKKDGISKNKKKVGIEHATTEVIKRALENVYETNVINNIWTYKDLFELGLTGNKNSKKLRDFISLKLNIGSPNAKCFLERLNVFQIKRESIEELIDEYGNNS